MVFYLGYYDTVGNQDEQRYYSPAARNKMEYIISKLDSIGCPVTVVSASVTKGQQNVPQREIRIGENSRLKLFFSLGKKNLLVKVLDLILIKFQLYMYLLRSVRKDDTLVAYHSLEYMRGIAFIRKIKGFRIILEVEELYADVLGKIRLRNNELKFASFANAYIFPTTLLNEEVNTANKPYAIVHGTYQVENDLGHRFDDGKIHVVYAGTLDPRKGGAAAAAATARFLPANYHVHILGFGSDEQINDMKNMVQEIAQDSNADVTYDGVLSGEEYIKFIQACDIGLSTQNPDAAFNATSFPSKVLSYMANGLRVVSARIKVVETSGIGDLIKYYDNQTPEEIAKAIIRVDITDLSQGRQRLSELDKSFSKELHELSLRDCYK